VSALDVVVVLCVSGDVQCAAALNTAGGACQPGTIWSLGKGNNMLIVGLMQGALSHPFFDPVLTGQGIAQKEVKQAVMSWGVLLLGPGSGVPCGAGGVAFTR
jgi:hypothetical protein